MAAKTLEACRGDHVVACFGELIVRLTPPARELLGRARMLEVHPGGAEANVAIALSNLGHATRMISRVPDDALGEMATQALRLAEVDVRQVSRGAGRMALYFMAAGAGVRASDIVYDRTGSAFAVADEHDFDWNAALDGVGLLHLSGITPALGSGPAALALAVARAAADRKIQVSFDCNYRANLWAAQGADPRPILRGLIDCASIVFGDHRDLALVLDLPLSGDDPASRREAAEAAFGFFPRLRLLASTRRHVHHVDRHSLSARLDAPGEATETEALELAGIIERIGGGDAFAAGVLHAVLTGETLDRTAELALGLAALKHSIPGDAATFSRAEIDHLLSGKRDVRR